MKRIVFFAGAAAGYVLGTRAGQQRYDQMRTKAEKLWSSPQVQDKVEVARRTLSERAPAVAEKVGAATRSAGGGLKGRPQGADGAGETIDLSTGDMGAGPLGSATLGQGVTGDDPTTGTGGDRLR